MPPEGAQALVVALDKLIAQCDRYAAKTGAASVPAEWGSSGHDYVLHYFPIRAVGQLSLYLLNAAGLNYTWDTEMAKNWSSEKEKQHFGQMPVLDVRHGASIAQSGAISRYLARVSGFMPADPMDEAKVNMVYEQFRDIRTKFGKMKYAGTSHWEGANFVADEPAQKKVLEELGSTLVPQMLLQVEKLYPESGPFLLGQHPTLADVAVFAAYRLVLEAGLTLDFNPLPKLQRVCDEVLKLGTLGDFVSKGDGGIYYFCGNNPPSAGGSGIPTHELIEPDEDPVAV